MSITPNPSNDGASNRGDNVPKDTVEAREPALLHYPLAEVVRAYKSGPVRIYSRIRAHILRGRLLQEVAQFIPQKGEVCELGCGFGIFTNAIAKCHPNVQFHGCDLAEGRIREASRVAHRLSNTNVEFVHESALTYIEKISDLQCVYMIDLVHHLPPESVEEFLSTVWKNIRPGGVLLVKDVSNKPWYKCAFTWILDVLMTKGEIPTYIPPARMIAILERHGPPVRLHYLDDYLPFPHVLYVLHKPEEHA